MQSIVLSTAERACQGHCIMVQLDKRGLLAYWHDLKATSALAFDENSSRGGLKTCLLSDQFTHQIKDSL